ncbi:MAG: hypothetical protein OEL76_01440 [Siculibacillus sp.]|nr:hypothetical protein [Siculibacillus sp.]
MRRRLIRAITARRLAFGAALFLGLAAVPALAGTTAEVRLAGVPSCDDEWTLSKIRDRFTWGAARVEKRDLAIVGVAKIREVHASVDRPSPIPRRWCAARVTLSDGSRSTLTWVVAGGVGFAGPGLAWIPDEVEFCVAGHDPWRVHDGACRTTRRWW